MLCNLFTTTIHIQLVLPNIPIVHVRTHVYRYNTSTTCAAHVLHATYNASRFTRSTYGQNGHTPLCTSLQIIKIKPRWVIKEPSQTLKEHDQPAHNHCMKHTFIVKYKCAFLSNIPVRTLIATLTLGVFLMVKLYEGIRTLLFSHRKYGTLNKFVVNC